jgi:hypothetical protein
VSHLDESPTQDAEDDLRYFGLFPSFQAVGQATAPCRVSLAILILGSAVLFVPDQTAEALTALCERRQFAVTTTFVTVVLSWGFTSWYFARQMLRFAYPDREALPLRVHALYHSTVVWLPRALGVAPPVATAVALLLCLSRSGTVLAPALWLLLFSALLFCFIVGRRGFLERHRPSVALLRHIF